MDNNAILLIEPEHGLHPFKLSLKSNAHRAYYL